MRNCGLLSAAPLFTFAALVVGTKANEESNSVNVRSFFIISPLVLLQIRPALMQVRRRRAWTTPIEWAIKEIEFQLQHLSIMKALIDGWLGRADLNDYVACRISGSNYSHPCGV